MNQPFYASAPKQRFETAGLRPLSPPQSDSPTYPLLYNRAIESFFDLCIRLGRDYRHFLILSSRSLR